MNDALKAVREDFYAMDRLTVIEAAVAQRDHIRELEKLLVLAYECSDIRLNKEFMDRYSKLASVAPPPEPEMPPNTKHSEYEAMK